MFITMFTKACDGRLSPDNLMQSIFLRYILILSQFRGVTIDGVSIGELDLLTICTRHSELQVIRALSLISTLYKSLHTKH
jgi:hypothetical protein